MLNVNGKSEQFDRSELSGDSAGEVIVPAPSDPDSDSSAVPDSDSSATERGSSGRKSVIGARRDAPDTAERPSIALVAPTHAQLLLRGFTRRCPWCGDRKAYFTGWFRHTEYCRHCGRGFRRGDDAYELSATTVNIILTFLSILISLAIAFGVMLATGGIRPIPIIVVGAFWALLGPAVFYPVSYTIWQGIDLFMRAPTPEELAGGPDAKL